MDPTTKEVLEIVIPTICVALLILYHVYLLFMFTFAKKVVNIGYQTKTREQYVYWVMFTPKAEIFAIQTFRNAIMAASFLGSLSTGLAFYILSRATNSIFIYQRVQLYSLSAIFFTSFLCFALFVRYVLHSMFILAAKDTSAVQIALGREKKKDDDEIIDIEVPEIGKLDPLRIKNRHRAMRNMKLLTIYFSLGIRFNYLGVPFALWISLGIWDVLINQYIIPIANHFQTKTKNNEFALIFYKDSPPSDYISTVYPFVSDFSKIKSILENKEFYGNTHNLCEGLATTLQDIEWNDQRNKFCIIICTNFSLESETIQPGYLKNKKISEVLVQFPLNNILLSLIISTHHKITKFEKIIESSNVQNVQINKITNDNITCWLRGISLSNLTDSKQIEKSKTKLPICSIDLFYGNNFISKTKIFQFNNGVINSTIQSNFPNMISITNNSCVKFESRNFMIQRDLIFLWINSSITDINSNQFYQNVLNDMIKKELVSIHPTKDFQLILMPYVLFSIHYLKKSPNPKHSNYFISYFKRDS
eukprot:gene10853-3473_t